MKFLKKLNLTVVVFCVCCIAFVAFLAYNPSHAYFQVHKDAIGVNTAKVDLLFDKYDESVFTNTTTYTGPTLNQNAEWGTEANPYIIRKKNHINNLAMLQKAGYFAEKSGQSYFVVCDLVGKPVAINCSDDSKMEIAPIGTPDNPFTGNINGAYIAGTANYTLKLDDTTSKTYTVSQSTIANLSVVATEETPDVGFFGRLGFVGKKQNETDGSISIVADGTKGPYSATINNVLFADIAVKNNVKVSNLGTWWGNFTGYDAAYENCNETHHVGIVAGHVEFATLTNISVYYTPNKAGTQAHVAAFELAGDTATNSTDKNNYYSITGILGTVVYVNPAVGEGGRLNSAPAISDKDLTEELLSGGGGEGSGMLTGYMLAENIFNRKDASNEMTTLDYYAEAYDVRNITENNGTAIFSKVTMQERQNASYQWENVDYYYFADTVFTFAMTATGNVTSNANLDYLIKIWDLSDENEAPPLYLTAEEDDWSHELTGDVAYLYQLQLVTGTSLTKGDYYVLAYRDTINAGQENAREVLRVLDINNSTGFATTVYPYTDNGFTGNDFTNNTVFYVSSSNASYYPSSFIYNYGNQEKAHADNHNTAVNFTITAADKQTMLGLYSSAPTSGFYFETPYLAAAATTNTKTDLVSAHDKNTKKIDQDSAKWFSWKISVSNSKATVSGDFYHRHINGGDGTNYSWYSARNYVTTYSSMLVYDTVSQQFAVRSNVGQNEYFILNGSTHLTQSRLSQYDEVTFPIASPTLAETDESELLIYRVVPGKNANNQATPYVQDISEKNMVAPSNALTFDSSKDVLFCNPVIRTENESNESFNNRVDANNSYELTPLINKKWNNGQGHYLKQLNHVVQMAKPTTFSHQVTFANTGSGWGSFYDRDFNTGGVVIAPLGDTGKSYAMPMGTIAFYILKASEAEPSYINIIVSVNPDGKKTTVGLWGPQDPDEDSKTFVSTSPDQAFNLPMSSVANNAALAEFTHISCYYEEKSDTPITNDGNGFYTHLGGEVAFVGCTFAVTEPGVYLLAPSSESTGRMSVAYFSVDGAAGAGGDGTGGSPLGNVDFVYDNNPTTGTASIITVDKMHTDAHKVDSENPESFYYPSYFYVRMLPKKDESTIPKETIYVRRYIQSTYPMVGGSTADRRRILQMVAVDPDTKLLTLSEVYGDINYDDITTTSN